MVKVFMGLPGSGKTKHLIELVNNAVENESGNVVCIELGQKLRFDLHYNVKLVDIAEYDFKGGFETLLAFVNGMYAGNYDITHIFMWRSRFASARPRPPKAPNNTGGGADSSRHSP